MPINFPSNPVDNQIFIAAGITYYFKSSSNVWSSSTTISDITPLLANDYTTWLSAQSNDGATLVSAQANDYTTWLSAQANDGATLLTARANDYTTYTGLTSAYQANDYTTWLSAQSNDYTTWLAAQSNDGATLLSARANDYTTWLGAQANDYSTWLASQSNDGATLLTARSNDWATYTTLTSAYQANDYATWLASQSNDGATLLTAQANDYTTWLSAQSNDGSTLLSARANDYTTWLSAQANDGATLFTARANDYATYISATSSANAQTSANTALYFTFVTGLDQITTIRSNTKLSYDASNSALNMNDAQLSRPALKDYALVRVDLGNATGSVSIDLEQGNFFTATSTGTTNWTFSNPPTGFTAGGFILKLTNGGSQTQNWPISTKWPGGNAPALTSAGIDVLVFMSDDAGTTWRGVASMLDSK